MLMPKAPLFFRLFGWTPIGDGEIIVLTLVQVAAIPGRPFADDEGSRRDRWSRRTPKSAKSNPYCFARAHQGVTGGVTRVVAPQATRASQDAGRVQ
jgi:hypothetical protein